MEPVLSGSSPVTVSEPQPSHLMSVPLVQGQIGRTINSPCALPRRQIDPLTADLPAPLDLIATVGCVPILLEGGFRMSVRFPEGSINYKY